MESGERTLGTMAQLTCLSFHFFYHQQPDILLVQLYRLIHYLEKQQELHHYFFIRYAEGGPHLRVRLFVDVNHTSKVRSLVMLLADRASLVKQVEIVDYQPEVDRYGGLEHIGYAPYIFHISSETIFAYLADKKFYRIPNRLHIAFGLHYLFLKAMNCAPEEITSVLQDFIKQWLPMIYRKPLSKDETDNLYMSFKKSFLPQQAIFKQVLRHLIDQAEVSNFNDAVLTSYYIQTKCYAAHYQKLSTEKRSTIFNSFMHMTNNRLGIPNMEEAFVAYLLLQTLQSIKHA